jgi:hypothetical protein
MGKITAGKNLEITACISGISAGSGESAMVIADFCKYYGVAGFRPTDEETAGRRKSLLFMEGHRVNNGRGEVVFDVIFRAPIIGAPGLEADVPFSLKGGDSRDISTDIPFVRNAVEKGMPIWVMVLGGNSHTVEYCDGVEMHLQPATHMTMRRINITPVFRDYIRDWSAIGDSANPAFIRGNKVNGKVYPRIRVNWGKIPEHYWLDKGPVPFSANAPIPSPY